MTHDLTAAQWAAVKQAWGGCAYCGTASGSLQKDCMLPIANGGRYTLNNVVPACPSCNASKRGTEVTTWLRRKHLDEAAFLTRQLQILTHLQADVAAPAPSAQSGHSGVSSRHCATSPSAIT